MPLVDLNQLTFEKTPGYLRNENTPKRILDFNPNMKFILIIRNPITRSISHFTHMKSNQKIKLTQKNKVKIGKEFENDVLNEDGNIKNNTIDKIIFPGVYVSSYKQWLQYFPKSQILVLNGENFLINPFEELKKVEKFLNLTSYFQKKHFIFDKNKGFFCINTDLNTEKVNCMGSGKGREHPIVSSKVIEKLKMYYEPYDTEFFNLINQKPFW